MSDRPPADTPVIKGAETIDLQEEGSPGVLLLHGFGDTPQTLSLLARKLHKAGYSVLAPLLPGNGRSMRDFSNSTPDKWIESPRRTQTEIRNAGDAVSIVGLSMVGAISTVLAAEGNITALVL